MAEGDNEKVHIHILLPDRVHRYLEELVRIGLWGETIEEVCERLILEGIQRAWPIIGERFQPTVNISGDPVVRSTRDDDDDPS